MSNDFFHASQGTNALPNAAPVQVCILSLLGMWLWTFGNVVMDFWEFDYGLLGMF